MRTPEPYDEECRGFLVDALQGSRWKIFVAVSDDGILASHQYAQLIDKVPRPGKKTRKFGYVTNVYTRPGFRGQGIGTAVSQALKQWAPGQELEFLLVWPSEWSVRFYERNVYVPSGDAMQLTLEPN